MFIFNISLQNLRKLKHLTSNCSLFYDFNNKILNFTAFHEVI